MKQFLLSLILFCTYITQASSSTFSIHDVASKLGLNIVSKGKPWTYPGVHRLYTNSSLSRAMLVIENVAGKKEEFTITNNSGFSLIEYPVSDSTYNSIALINISEIEIETYLTRPQTTVYQKIDHFLSYFLSSAHAEDTCGTQSFETLTGSSLVEISDFYSQQYFQLASSCLMGVLEGAWEATGGMVESSAVALKRLATDPKAFWEEKVESFSRLKNFLMDFELNMQKTLSSFKKLPDEVKAQMMCSFISSIGTDTLIAVLTAGAASSKLALSLQSFTSKFLKLEKLLLTLNQMGKLREIPSKFYDYVTKGLISDKRLTSIKALAHHEFDDLALQLVKCSL